VRVIFRKLKNGLDVFIYEDHRTPIFSFVILYAVGSMDECPGITGVSHILEHMTFKGSDRVDGTELNRFIRRHGGYMNAETHEDRTIYYMTLPISELEYPLETWSDLMTNAKIDEKDFKSEREVVIEERRLQTEDNPIGALFESLNATSFWAHPYRWPVIGWMSDLERITRDEVYEYYRSYYRPDNAVIVMKGDFKEDYALGLIEKYFGNIPNGNGRIKRANTVEPIQIGMRRSEIHKPAELPLVMMGFHAPGINDDNVFPLLVVEKILSSGESSRIFKNIILEKRLSTGAGGVFSYVKRDPGLFIFYAQAAPDKTPADLETALWEEVDKLTSENISFEEIEKAKNIVEAQFIYRMESNLSESVSRGEFHLVSRMEKYDSFVEKIRGVNQQSIMEVCQKTLSRDNSSIVQLIPENKSGSGRSVEIPQNPSRYLKCNYIQDNILDSGKLPDGLPFWKDSDRFQLPNSLQVIAYHRDDLPIVQMGMLIKTGACYDPPIKAGLASLCGNLLRAGTKSRSSADISEEIERLGSQFSISVQREFVAIGMQFLSRYYKTGFDVLSDCLIYPAFSDDEVSRYKELQSGEIKSAEDDVWRLAPREFVRNLFQTPSYSNPLLGELETVNSFTRSDVLDFYNKYYKASNMILSVVGDYDKSTIKDDITRYFSGMDSLPSAEPPVNEPKKIDSQVVAKYQKDTSQASIVMGNYSFQRKSDDYYAFLLMNLILGGDSLTSRLGYTIREKNGLVYFIQSGFTPMTKTGYWQIMLQTKNENASRAIELIREEIRKMRDTNVSDEELNDAKSNLRGRSALEIESNSGLIIKLLSIAYYGLEDDYMENLFRKIEMVTREQVMDVARRYLDPERYLVMIVGEDKLTG
jgi:zinc protease